jgi:hypothetical protein
MSILESIALIEAAGLDPKHMTTRQVYEVHGRLIQDKILTDAALKFLDGSILRKGSRALALKEMSAGAKAELRERIQA